MARTIKATITVAKGCFTDDATITPMIWTLITIFLNEIDSLHNKNNNTQKYLHGDSKEVQNIEVATFKLDVTTLMR
jgi:hypothetical protein